MCVIINGLRKKKVDRNDVLKAMKHNSSGFFMSHWKSTDRLSSDRKSIRTLNESDAVRFFDSIPDDDVFVMHARIPSKGGVNLENVHGWEEDGITFCHNMTMSSLSDLMDSEKWTGTDSEYFFRKLFIPMNRGEHLSDTNLKVGEMGPATRRLVSLLCGTSNKFLFIMPDNTVIRAGRWETLSSEKRTMTEEREVDEIIGESIDINGKVVNKTVKVKKQIEVEREFATVLASNTSFRSETLYQSSNAATGKWNPETRKFEYSYPSGKYEYQKPLYGKSDTTDKTVVQSPYERYRDYGYDEFDYDFDTNESPAKEELSLLKSDKQSKSKLKKSDISPDDIVKFKEWRSNIPGYKNPEIITQDSLESYGLFHDLEFVNGTLTPESMRRIFEMILRCIIYHNYRENIVKILDLDVVSFIGDKDVYGIYTTSFANNIDLVIPTEFDDSLHTYACKTIYDLYDRMFVDMNTSEFILPSEALMETFGKFVKELDFNFISSDFLGMMKELDGTEKSDSSKNIEAAMTAIDRLLNISFDNTSKSSKDVEKYVKAATISNGRKIKWIDPALILSSDPSMVSPTGDWITSKSTTEFKSVLNFMAEACVTGGESLKTADNRYVAFLKNNLGYDFSKKDSSDTESDKPESNQEKTESEKDKDHEERILAEPEKVENPSLSGSSPNNVPDSSETTSN